MNTQTELKPCPFCGTVPKLTAIVASRFWVSCKNRRCGINPETRLCETQDEAVSTWNERRKEGLR
jgi:hypothetical protein